MSRWPLPLLPLLLQLSSHLSPVLGPSLAESAFINCFSCASAEYESLALRMTGQALFGRPLLFDALCDSRVTLAALSSSALVPCDSACVTVLEPQFFGGVQNERRPFAFVRGCASDIFELAIASAGPEGVPAEIDFLHRAQACLELPIGQIWPPLASGTGSSGSNPGELVRVCSCLRDECNALDDLDSAAQLSAAPRRPGTASGTGLLSAIVILLSLGHQLLLNPVARWPWASVK